jgi:hypothetical protein
LYFAPWHAEALGVRPKQNGKKYPLMNGDEISRKWIQPAEERHIFIGVELVDTNQQKNDGGI